MRKLVILLAAALALTACTAAPEVSSPAEAAPPAETAAIGEAAAAFPVGTLQMAPGGDGHRRRLRRDHVHGP